MKQMRLLGFRPARFLPALCLLALPVFGQSSNSMRLGDGGAADTRASFGSTADVPLTLSTTDEVQGVVAVFEWNDGGLTGEDLVVADGPGEALEGADTVVTTVEADHMILGVVMDSDPDDPGSPEIIGPGDDILLATAVLRCGNGPEESSHSLEFVDGVHSTVAGGPELDNIVVVGGLSIGREEGLGLEGTTVRCIPQPDSLTIESGGNPETSACGDIRILMTNNQEVEGFVTAVCHNSTALRLDTISLGSAAAAADFTAFEIDPFVGGTFGVVMDLEDPMAMPPNIDPGADQHVATYRYCCNPQPSPGSPVVTIPLMFCDGELGEPAKQNLLVVGGRSITQSEGLELNDGEFTCRPGAGGRETDCGSDPDTCCSNGVDDDNDGFTDCEDSDCRGTGPCPLEQSFLCGTREAPGEEITSPRGTPMEVCFYVLTPEDNAVGHAQFDHIQGFSMSVSYCCDLTCVEDFDISDTILEALGAEFVSIQCDNDPNDGDGCELILGVLIDALPPFDGATIPPSPDPQRVGCVTFIANEDAECDAECPIEFVDGLNGRGNVPVKNLMSLENHSFTPALVSCSTRLLETPRFHRGDCNFSLMGSMSVDIADAAAVVSYLFLPGSWQFQPGCLDACDCNDDGRVDLADAICILQYLFQFGRVPPAPGPGYDPSTGEEVPPGPDPTDDKLDCELGTACVLMPH